MFLFILINYPSLKMLLKGLTTANLVSMCGSLVLGFISLPITARLVGESNY